LSRVHLWPWGRALCLIWLFFLLGGTSHVSAAPPAQTEIDVTDLVDVINRWHLSAFRGYKFSAWIALGDVMQFNARVADGDVQVYLDQGYLQGRQAVAAYVDCDGFGCANYYNDIVLADQPANVDPRTLWHESMHAIFDAHDSELLVPDDEIYTWYMDNTFTALRDLLTSYEDEYNKGASCDLQRLEKLWSMFEQRMADAKAGTGFYGPITSDAQLQQLQQLTGFRVDVATIQANYAAAGMDECPAATPTAQVRSAVDRSVILVIDASGSMDGTKIEDAKSSAKNLLGSIGSGQEVGLMVFYDCGSIGWTPFSTDPSSFVSIIDGIYASGGTPLGESIRAAGAHMAQEASGKEGTVVVLTDGGESCGDDPVDAAASVYQMTMRQQISRTPPWAMPVAYAAGGDIVVSVVGFDIDDATVEEQLRAIAEAGGGEFFAASDVQELNQALQRAAGGRGVPTLLLVGAGLTACLVPLGLIMIVILAVRSRRKRRAQAAVPQPAYMPVQGAGAMYAAPQYGSPPQYSGPSVPPGGWSPQGATAPPRYTAPPPQYNGPPRYGTPAHGTPVPFRAIGAGELALLNGQANPEVHDLSLPAVRIGRSAQGNHIVVLDPLVSGTHAEIRAQGGGHYIQDLRSTNGTYVNGERIVRPHPLSDGDRITLGNSEWLYRRSGGTVIMER
jgi:Mg-chelatase subunit ChlD